MLKKIIAISLSMAARSIGEVGVSDRALAMEDRYVETVMCGREFQALVFLLKKCMGNWDWH